MSAESDFQTLLVSNIPDQARVSFNGALVHHVFAELGFRTPAEFGNSTSPAGHTRTNTVPVGFIEEIEKLPADFIQNLPQGSKEYFATLACLR